MTQPKKKIVIKKSKVIARKKPQTQTKIEEPKDVQSVSFSFAGMEELKKFQPSYFDEISIAVKKFQSRHGVKLEFLLRFKAFKLKRDNKHIDWISLNDLTNRYDCRMPPVKMQLQPQRPFKKNRVY